MSNKVPATCIPSCCWGAKDFRTGFFEPVSLTLRSDHPGLRLCWWYGPGRWTGGYWDRSPPQCWWTAQLLIRQQPACSPCVLDMCALMNECSCAIAAGVKATTGSSISRCKMILTRHWPLGAYQQALSATAVQKGFRIEEWMRIPYHTADNQTEGRSSILQRNKAFRVLS